MVGTVAEVVGIAADVVGIVDEVPVIVDDMLGIVDEVLGIAADVLVIAAEVLGIVDEMLGIVDEMLGIVDEVLVIAAEVLGIVAEVVGIVAEVLGIAAEVLGIVDEVLGIVAEVLGIAAEVLGVVDEVPVSFRSRGASSRGAMLVDSVVVRVAQRPEPPTKPPIQPESPCARGKLAEIQLRGARACWVRRPGAVAGAGRRAGVIPRITHRDATEALDLPEGTVKSRRAPEQRGMRAMSKDAEGCFPSVMAPSVREGGCVWGRSEGRAGGSC